MTIEGTPRAAMTTLKGWKISPTSSFAPAPFNSGPPKSATDVEDYLSEAYDPQRRQETRLFRIEAQHSRDPIDTETGVLKVLLDHIDAFPALHNVLGAFRRDMMDSQNGTAAAHYSHHHHHTSNPLLELCQLLKYVEPHSRPSPPVGKARQGYCEVQRWSVRQMAFYQSFHLERQFESALLVNPSIQLVHDLRHQYKKSSAKPYENWMQLPQLVFESLPANWSEYTSALYRAVEEVYNDAYFTDPQQPRIDEADSHSLQTCSELMDRLQQADHVLTNNISILQTALQMAQQRTHTSSSSTKSSTSSSHDNNNNNNNNNNLSTFTHATTETLTSLQFHLTHLHLSSSRLSQTFTSIHNLIQLRSSHNMEHMTERSILEARTVRLIALVTLFFIPPTFTAGFLQMGGLNFDASTRGHLVVTVEAKFLFFLAITVPLMLLVMGAAWVAYNWYSVRSWGRGEGRRGGGRGGGGGRGRGGGKDGDGDENGGGSDGV